MDTETLAYRTGELATRVFMIADWLEANGEHEQATAMHREATELAIDAYHLLGDA